MITFRPVLLLILFPVHCVLADHSLFPIIKSHDERIADLVKNLDVVLTGKIGRYVEAPVIPTETVVDLEETETAVDLDEAESFRCIPLGIQNDLNDPGQPEALRNAGRKPLDLTLVQFEDVSSMTVVPRNIVTIQLPKPENAPKTT